MYLNYFGALTNRYEGMSQEEKEHLCALIMYEAGKRFVAGSAEDRATYSLIVAAAEAQGDREEEVFGDCLCGLIVV